VSNEFAIFSGTANPRLSAAIAAELGVPLRACRVDRFPDGEIAVQLLESVRRQEVFIVQSTSPPTDSNLVELLAFADACRRAAAGGITAIVPYFGYGRADKRVGLREPIMARVVADMLATVGIAHVVVMDLHTPQIEGFFHIPVDSLSAVPTMCLTLRNDLPKDVVVVSPDIGRVRVAGLFARCLASPMVVLRKSREGAATTVVAQVIGTVAGRACLIVDDMITTGGTMVSGIAALLSAEARSEIFVAATHGLLLPGAREKLAHPAVRKVFVTDTVRVPDKAGWPQLCVISIAPLIGAAIKRFLANGSIGDLYQVPAPGARQTHGEEQI
jgi:ribose-phosphate pyrophosphokinase